MRRLGHLLAGAGVLAAGTSPTLDTSAWPGVALATVGALLVAIDSIAQWAAAEEMARNTAAAHHRLDALEKQLTQMAARLETAERRDALGRM